MKKSYCIKDLESNMLSTQMFIEEHIYTNSTSNEQLLAKSIELLEIIINSYRELKAEYDAATSINEVYKKSDIYTDQRIHTMALKLEIEHLKQDRDLMAQSIMDQEINRECHPVPQILQNDIQHYQQQIIQLNNENQILKNQIIESNNQAKQNVYQGVEPQLKLVDMGLTDIFQAENPYYLFLVLRLLSFNAQKGGSQSIEDDEIQRSFDAVEVAGYQDVKKAILKRITRMGQIERNILQEHGIH